MKVAVMGASGLIGTKVVARLMADGHDVVAASRSSGVDVITGAGLADVLAGADALVDVLNAPSCEADTATSEPINGIRNIGGAAKVSFEQMARDVLARRSDTTTRVVMDAEARYFGARLSMDSLVTPDIG